MNSPACTIPQSAFRSQLAVNIREYIIAARRDGVSAMSEANLRQCVQTPASSLQGAPNGTNAQYFYALLFAEVLATVRVQRFSILP